MTYPTKDGLAIHTGSCKVKEGTFEQEFEVEKVLDARGTSDERFYLVQRNSTLDRTVERNGRNRRLLGEHKLGQSLGHRKIGLDKRKNQMQNLL